MTKFVLPENPNQSQIMHLSGNPEESIEVIVSDDNGREPRSSAKHHGDFDNDDTTMKSVVETILRNSR